MHFIMQKHISTFTEEENDQFMYVYYAKYTMIFGISLLEYTVH